MSAAVYALRTFDPTVTDGVGLEFRLYDIQENPDQLQVRAMVASGDYFETLAARLEQVADVLPVRSVEQYQLQDAVTQLLYLQRDYTITKK